MVVPALPSEPLMSVLIKITLGEAVLPMLGEAVGVQSAEAKLLDQIGRDEQAMLNGPRRADNLYLGALARQRYVNSVWLLTQP